MWRILHFTVLISIIKITQLSNRKLANDSREELQCKILYWLLFLRIGLVVYFDLSLLLDSRKTIYKYFKVIRFYICNRINNRLFWQRGLAIYMLDLSQNIIQSRLFKIKVHSKIISFRPSCNAVCWKVTRVFKIYVDIFLNSWKKKNEWTMIAHSKEEHL